MNRFAVTVLVGLMVATAVQAEPLPWSYYARFQAAGGKDRILLGMETAPSQNEDSPPSYFTYTTGGFGPSRINFETPIGSERLFTFGYSQWEKSDLPPDPETTSINKFTLMYGFTKDGETVSGSVDGSISASGVFTTGTGNFWILLDESQEVQLGGRLARVRFSSENTENLSAIRMQVEELALTTVQTPEPASLLMGGIGLGTVALRRWRRNRTPIRG